jgi:metal-sulfur cluster biosynthetic enzyme
MGLGYYPIAPDFQFELELHEHSNKETIQIEDTEGNIRQFLRWGEFRFNVGGEQCTIQCYKSDPEEDRFFIPFRDATSGKETYGAGRYLDIDSGDLTTNGKWDLDFNKAYNPWCAYNENYACPFVPPENWLKVSIRAGEKDYPLRTEEESKMADTISEKEVGKVISQVGHPAIDCTLVDLGIVKDWTVEGNRVKVLLAFPSLDIPIKDYIVGSVRDAIEKLGAKVEVELSVMSQEEIQRFIDMEREHWKGII